MSTGDVENHLSQWFRSPLGRYVLRFEKELFDDAVKDVFGYNAVQIGLSERNFLELNRISNRVIISGGLASSISADLSLLPIKSSSVDLVLLPHTLECSSDPHAVVREVERILVPGGRVVISSLNPFSLFGLRYRCWGVKEGPAKCKELVSLARIKDWLNLLVSKWNLGGWVVIRCRSNRKNGESDLDFWSSRETVGGRYLVQCIFCKESRKSEVCV